MSEEIDLKLKCAKYLALEAKRMRILLECDLHRLEKSALNTLKQHGLKVKRSNRHVSIAGVSRSGAGGGYGIGLSPKDPRHLTTVAKLQVVLDKKRLCHFTYDIDQMHEVALKILGNRKAALADTAAAVVALSIEQLWIDYSLSNAQSSWFTLGLLKATSLVPTEETSQQLISESKKRARGIQQEPLNKLAKAVIAKAKLFYRDDKNQTVQSTTKLSG